MSIAILTDTDASLPQDVAQQYGIRQVPILVNFGAETLKAVEEIDDATTFARIRAEGKLPTTAAPSPGDFAQAFEEAFAQGAEEILCFTVSSQVSGTYAAALNARELLADKPITVVDTQSLSMGQGFMVLAAAEAVRQGATSAEAVDYAKAIRQRTHLFAALPTLKYLAMSGRVGHLAAGMANLLHIMPILTIRDGKLDLLEKVRTRKKAWQRVIHLTAAQAPQGVERLAMLHVNAEEHARQLHELLCQQLPCPQETLYAPLTPGLSVHAGEGLVGVAFVAR